MNMDIDIDEEDQSKAVMLFGRDIRKIPCLKHSIMYGIYSSLATVLVTFMLTSRVNLAMKMSLGSYIGVSTTYMCYCRYDYTKQKFAMKDIQYILRQQESDNAEEQNKLDA